MRELLEKLYLLAELKPGKTLSVREMTIIDHTFLASWNRWWHNEDRFTTLDKVREIIDEVYRSIPALEESERKRILFALLEAKKGITSLLETYQDDARVCSRVNTILSEMTSFISNIKKEVKFLPNFGLGILD